MISLGGAGHIKLSKELQSADANYWLRSGTTEWRIDYVGGTNAEEAEELEVETDLSLEPMKFVISGASDDQVKFDPGISDRFGPVLAIGGALF